MHSENKFSSAKMKCQQLKRIPPTWPLFSQGPSNITLRLEAAKQNPLPWLPLLYRRTFSTVLWDWAWNFVPNHKALRHTIVACTDFTRTRTHNLFLQIANTRLNWKLLFIAYILKAPLSTVSAEVEFVWLSLSTHWQLHSQKKWPNESICSPSEYYQWHGAS